MPKNILTPVTNTEYNSYLDNFYAPKYFPEEYLRLSYAVLVISSYLEKGDSSDFTMEDVAFELRKAYIISLEMQKLKNTEKLVFCTQRIVVYAYSKLGFSKYRKGKKPITREIQMIAILLTAKNALVSKGYQSAYR